MLLVVEIKLSLQLNEDLSWFWAKIQSIPTVLSISSFLLCSLARKEICKIISFADCDDLWNGGTIRCLCNSDIIQKQNIFSFTLL